MTQPGESDIPVPTSWLTWAQIESAVYQAAGVGSGAVMALAAKVVMPSEEVKAGCDQILADLKTGTFDQ